MRLETAERSISQGQWGKPATATSKPCDIQEKFPNCIEPDYWSSDSSVVETGRSFVACTLGYMDGQPSKTARSQHVLLG